MIGTGLGIAFLPSLYVRSEIAPRKDVQSVTFKGATYAREVVLAWRKGSSKTEFYKQITVLMKKQITKSLANFVTPAKL